MVRIISIGLLGMLIFFTAVGSLNLIYNDEWGFSTHQRETDQEKKSIMSDKAREALRDFFGLSEAGDEQITTQGNSKSEINKKDEADSTSADTTADTDRLPVQETDTTQTEVVEQKPEPQSEPEPESEPVIQTGPQRTSGYPPKGASSFHLWWDVPSGQYFKEISVTVEVKDIPSVNELYFWALQVSFYEEDGQSSGGAHTGIQWHPYKSGSPFMTVNWGGYDGSGNILSGTESFLPPKLDDPNDQNTRSYSWLPNRQYKLRIYKITESPGVWRAEITDVSTGDTKVIRDLYGGGSWLGSPVVWSEIFAKCDNPSSSVVWKNFKGIKSNGQSVSYNAASVNYQSYNNGGCANTNSETVSGGIKQTTNTVRTTEQGATLSF